MGLCNNCEAFRPLVSLRVRSEQAHPAPRDEWDRSVMSRRAPVCAGMGGCMSHRSAASREHASAREFMSLGTCRSIRDASEAGRTPMTRSLLTRRWHKQTACCGSGFETCQ